jgi:hypothetical protein
MGKSHSKVNEKTGTMTGTSPAGAKTKTPLEKVLEKLVFRIDAITALNLRDRGIDTLDFLEALLYNEFITWADESAYAGEYNIVDIQGYHQMCELFGIDLLSFCEDPILEFDTVVTVKMKPEWEQKLARVGNSTFSDVNSGKESNL